MKKKKKKEEVNWVLSLIRKVLVGMFLLILLIVFIAQGLGFPAVMVSFLLIVVLFQQEVEDEEWKTKETITQKGVPNADAAILGLISVIMKADGQPTKSELNEVKAFLLEKFGEKNAKKMLLLLKEKLNKEIRNVRPHCLSINRAFTYPQKLEFITLLFRIAEISGEICQNEADILSRIAKHIAIRNSDFTELTHEFSTFYSYQKKQTTIVYHDSGWAHRVLLIEENASMEEIKKAYRKLAMEHHPDKVDRYDLAAQKQATEKFHQICEAYKHLQKEKR